jgi:hypothetical protein
MQAFAAFFPSGVARLVIRMIHPFIGASEAESGQPGSQALFEGAWLGLWVNREPLKEINVPVRIFETNRGGQIFSEKAFTERSVSTARSGVQAQPKVAQIVGVTLRQDEGSLSSGVAGPAW